MKIDTSYPEIGVTSVTMKLETTEEKALPDDLLARIGANQHRLRWGNGFSGTVEIVADPATFPLPLSHRDYVVKRSDDNTVTVSYGRAQVEWRAKSVVLALAASFAIAFGTISTLRYNDTFHHTLPLNYPSAYT